MKYGPSAIADEDLDIAQAPYLGGEFSVFLSKKPAVLLGELELSASGNGTTTGATYTAASGASIKSGGSDIQCVAIAPIRSEVACTVVFNVKDESNVSRTLTFTFEPAARAADQSYDFQRGVAVDGVLSGGTKVTEITSLASVTGGRANVNFALYQLPEATDYKLVGCTTNKKFNTKSRMPVGIDCQMEADAFVKRGKTKKGELTIDSKFRGLHQNLIRYDGDKCTAMLVGIKDGQVTCDRIVFTQYVPSVEIDLPDGDGEAMENAASGKFVEHLFFTAP